MALASPNRWATLLSYGFSLLKLLFYALPNEIAHSTRPMVCAFEECNGSEKTQPPTTQCLFDTTTQYRLNETIWIVVTTFACRSCAILAAELYFAQAHELWHSICYILAVNGSGFPRNGILLHFRLVYKTNPLHQIHVDDSSTNYFCSHVSNESVRDVFCLPQSFLFLSFPLVACKQYASMHKTLHFSPYSRAQTIRIEMVARVRARTMCVDANWGADETNGRKTNNKYIHSCTWMRTQVACKPFVRVRESLPSSRSMLHCALWINHGKHMECHVVSRVFFCSAFGIAESVECVQYEERKKWKTDYDALQSQAEWKIYSPLTPSFKLDFDGCRRKKCVYNSIVCLQNISLLSTTYVEHKNPARREKMLMKL